MTEPPATPRAGFTLPVSKFKNRLVWTFLTTIPLMWVWILTAEKGGNQWPVSIAYISTTIFIWTVPTAEQVAKMIQSAAAFKADPLASLGYGGLPDLSGNDANQLPGEPK